MKPLIFDATPLIHLTKVGQASLIEAIQTRKYAARPVFQEVVERGKAKGVAGALVLARLFETGAITIADASDTALLRTLAKIRGLEEPDAETLAIAKEFNYGAVVDDLLARRVARTCGIDFVGTPYVILLGIRNSLLTKEEAVDAIDSMIEAGWRCGAELYREIVRLINES
jgi:predicted nucleic acid-binding protein